MSRPNKIGDVASYMNILWDRDRLTEALNTAEEKLKDIDFDTVAGTGLSGSLFAFALARELDKHLLVIRKPGDHSHSRHEAEGYLGRKWLFVDDLVDTGTTLTKVISAVANMKPRVFHTQYIGNYLYADSVLLPKGFTNPTPHDLLLWNNSRAASAKDLQ